MLTNYPSQTNRRTDDAMGVATRIRGMNVESSLPKRRAFNAYLQVICRDIWALNLALLPDPPPAEPYHHAQENRAADPDGQESDSPSRAKQDAEDHGEGGSDREEADNEEKGQENLEAENEDEAEDSELEALMRENSEISSSSDDEEGDVPNAGLKYKKGRGRFAYESPMSTIAVLVVACWTMRIPVLYCDFTR